MAAAIEFNELGKQANIHSSKILADALAKQAVSKAENPKSIVGDVFPDNQDAIDKYKAYKSAVADIDAKESWEELIAKHPANLKEQSK